jgi:hypothetical protein
VLTGEAAKFVRNLKAEVKQFGDEVPDARTFQQRFTERFADTPGFVDQYQSVESGSLHLNLYVVRERGSSAENWSSTTSVTSADWELATTAPSADKLAQNLQDSLTGGVDKTALPKYLHVRVETEVDWALNKYVEAVIYFVGRNSPEFRGYDEKLSQWVWEKTSALEKALQVTSIVARD